MATNPNRPEYMDTIESTWGQSVADHVIRRYGTEAERDADLAALTPADLEGQVVAIGSGFPALCFYTGGRWIYPADVQAGQAWISTDGASNAYITFPRQFAGVPQTVLANAGAGTQNGVVFSGTSARNTQQAQITAWNGTGGAFGAGAVFLVDWYASYIVGAPPPTTREEFIATLEKKGPDNDR